MEKTQTKNRAGIVDKAILTPLLILGIVGTVLEYMTINRSTDLSLYTSFLVIAFLLGASLASFIGAMVERLPSGESASTPSHCACGRNLKAWENVPVLGWLWLRITHKGYTKCCQAKLPASYFLLESLTGLSFASITLWVIGSEQYSFFALLSMVVASLIVIISLSDYRNIAGNEYP